MRKLESLLGRYKNMLRGRMSSFDARLGRDGIHSMKLLCGCLEGFRIRSEVIDEDSMLVRRCDYKRPGLH